MPSPIYLKITPADLSRICDAIEYALEHEGLSEEERQLKQLYDRLNDVFLAGAGRPKAA